MEELVKAVSARAGITEEQAQTAVETVYDYVKDKIPAPFQSVVESMLKGEAGNSTDQAKNLFGGMFGK